MSVVFTGIGVEPVPINFVKMYSDGTPMIKTDKFSQIVEECNALTLRAGSLIEFVYGMFMVDSITIAGGEITRLVLPYLPGARQDRSNPTGDVLFTARSVADLINDRRFEQVVSVDPHSEVMPGFIRHFREHPLEKVYEKLWDGYTGVIAPDKGAQARAYQAAKVLGKGHPRYGAKVRDVATGALTGFQVEKLETGGHYVVIDDICDGGGTFIGLGEKIREQGAHADLFVTHGIFSKGTRELKKIYKNIYTTDTRNLRESNDVYVLPVVEEMENYNV